MVYAVVTGGGTSGHVIPAQAILEGLQESGHRADTLRYVGSRRGVENQLMYNNSVECVFLPISGLQRSFSLRSIARNCALPIRLLRSTVMARQLLKKWKPSVVVSVGGYASEPMARAAISAGVPLVCVSYDRMPGLATRRQAKHAAVCAVAFPDSELPRNVHTGAPVRAAIRHLNVEHERAAARRELDIPLDSVLITVTGGSLGSEVLNTFVSELLRQASPSDEKVAIFHVCGDRNLNDPLPSNPHGVWYRRVGYESRMTQVFAATDVFVGRAGASTIAEIATVGLASVVVPWAGAADDHQRLNAEWLSDSDAAIVVTEKDVVSGVAASSVLNLVRDRVRRQALAENARVLGEPHRSQALIRTIENAAL